MITADGASIILGFEMLFLLFDARRSGMYARSCCLMLVEEVCMLVLDI